MSRTVAALALATFTGAALLLSELRWFRRARLADRLRPYAPIDGGRGLDDPFTPTSVVELLTALASEFGDALARGAGVAEPLALRLRRIHSAVDPAAFRLQQLSRAGLALLLGAALSVATGAPPIVAMLLSLGTPLLVFLAIEQRLSSASASWQRRTFLELPVVTEQLGMLLGAGWSLGAALQRIADRGSGVCARDLRRVTARVGHGLSEIDALREWGGTADVDVLHRLVGVLALNRESTDLDRLIAQEARAMRRDAHRELVATIEKRAQQVWIPVTVAALVPGVLLMGVPFIDALTRFSS